MARNTNVRNAVKLALAVNAGLLGLSAAPGALAQDDVAGELEEITVTGSRIKKKDFTSNAPVATVGFEQIELTGTVNTESLLNTLPQTVPGLDRTSNNPGNGTATVDLRGLGSNRTLVLINGTRAVPTTAGGSVDINAIPNALIQNIEVLTGGASAVYGSDAVAGVVNFILKDDFEGVAINAGYEVTGDSDASITSTDITLGANVADGRGNVTFNFSFTDRDDLFQGDRDFSTFAFFDDGSGGFINGGSSGIPATSIFSAAFGTFSPCCVTFDQNGDIRPFITTGPNNDFYNYAPVNYIQLPQTRYQSTALGHFDVSDKATVYGRAMFTSSKVPQQLAATPIFASGTQFTLDGSPFLTANSQQILSDAFGDGVDTDADGIDDTATAFVRRRLLEVGPRRDESSSASYQLQVGVRGELTESWDYDAYVQQGNVNFDNTQDGNVDRTRFAQALLLDLAADPTGNTCVNPSAGGGNGPCAPINIFGEGNISEAGAAFLRTSVSATADYDQLIGGVTFTGDLGALELPGGAIGAAIGFEHIEQDFSFRPSQDLATGNIAGFNGSPAVAGGFDVDSAYVEFYLPILSGSPMAELLDMELAYRSSDYSTAGSVESSKISASWAPNDQFRIRGGFNQAVRAPSIGELFQPQAEGFPGATDPCAAEGPNSGDPQVAAICVSTGVPAGVVGSASINLPAGQVRALFGGNPALQEETADTYTYGVVVTPSAIEGLTFSVDYFDIEIEEFVTTFGGGAANVLNTCYDPTDALGGIGSAFCNLINRRADGTIDNVSQTLVNAATQTLNGFDLLASYDMDLAGGDFRINFVATFTEESDFTSFAGASPIECAGNFGALCGEPLPEYKHRTTFRWTGDKITGQLLWRYVGEVNDDDPGTAYSVEKIDGQSYFDASGTYRFNDNYAVTFGIDNLLDEEPPLLGDNQEQANTWPATYDVFGRTFFLRASADF